MKIPGAPPASEMGPGAKIGRNDPCPCGSGKKWKKCGLLNTEEHQKNMASGGKKHEVTGDSESSHSAVYRLRKPLQHILFIFIF